MKELNLFDKFYYNGKETYSAHDLYSRDILGPFNGYEFTGEFRPPKGEEYYAKIESPGVIKAYVNHQKHEPKAILIKSNDDKFIKFSITSKVTSWAEIQDSYNNRWPYGEKREFVEPEGYKFTGEYRSPFINEYFLNTHLVAEKAFTSYLNPKLILKKIEMPETSLPVTDPQGFDWSCAKRAKITPLPCIMLTGLDLMVHIGEKETAETIYGRQTVHAPAGYEFTLEFRCPKKGEYYLSSTSFCVVYCNIDDYVCPKLILKKLNNTYLTKLDGLGLMFSEDNKYTAKDVYECNSVTSPIGFKFTGEFRVPKQDEYFLSAGKILQMSSGRIFNNPTVFKYDNVHLTIRTPRLILRKL